MKLANRKDTKWKMGRPDNRAGCTKSGKSINGQGAIKADRVSNFSEKNKRACLFIRQMRVPVQMQLDIYEFLLFRQFKILSNVIYRVTMLDFVVSLGFKLLNSRKLGIHGLSCQVPKKAAL